MKTHTTLDQDEVLSNELLLENRIKINRIFSIVMIVFSVVLLCVTLFSFTGLYNMGQDWCRNIMIITSIVILGISLFTYIVKINPTATTYILNTELILLSALLYFLYTTTVTLFVIPILIATMYFYKKFIIFNSISVFVVFVIILQLGIYLERVSPAVQELHILENVIIYQYPKDIFNYVFIPKMIILTLSSIIGLFASSNGKMLIIKQAHNTRKLSRVNHELDTASRIQQNILPKNSFTTKGLEVNLYASMTPAKETAGDFYDYFYVDNNTLGFVVGDVSDKGLAAAMFMMIVKSYIKSITQNKKNLKECIEIINNILCENNDQNMFVTLWIGYLNLTNGDVVYINAGHPFPIVKHSDDSIEVIENTPNLFIGAFKDVTYDIHSFNLKKGDKLFIYTDGATDAVNSDNVCFGTSNLYKLLEKDYLSPISLCKEVIKEIEKHSGKTKQFDDITVMCLERMENSEPGDNEIVLFAKDENIGKVIDTINNFIEGKCGDKCRRDIDVVIDEICANICSYAKNNVNMTVKYEVSEETLSLVFIDDGQKFNPLIINVDKQDALSLGGNGILLIKNLTDSIEYNRENHQNILKVTKKLTND